MESKIKLTGRLRNYMYWPFALIILLVLLNIPAYVLNLWAGVIVSAFTVLYTIIIFAAYQHYKPKLFRQMIRFANQYGSVQRTLLDESELPIALLDNTGKVLWINKQFEQISGKDKDYRKSVATIFPAITKEQIQKKADKMEIAFVQEEKHYRACLSKLYFDQITDADDRMDLWSRIKILSVGETQQEIKREQFLTVLHLFDETQLHQYMTENREMGMVSALAYIDNYDEALESIEEVKRAFLAAMVDRKVNQYFAKHDGIVKKLEKDKYFIIFMKKNLPDFIEDRFNLMEEVKTIRVGNELAVTLSLGVGVAENSYIKSYEYSRMAIDLALGRGGDQAVLKEGDQISYYGGKSRQVEKMAKVKARVKAQALREIMTSKEKILVMGHKLGDVDSFGASIGICCMARTLGKKAYVVINDVSSSVRPLMDLMKTDKNYPNDMFIRSENSLEHADPCMGLIVVDINRPHMVEAPELLRRAKTVVVLDHHRQSSDFIENTVLSYVETYASSTCEMITEVLQYFGENVRLSLNEADCIYAGIQIDTNNFMTKTGVRTFEAAAYLRRNGADVTRVRKLLRNDMATYKARAEAVRQATVFREIFAISVAPPENVESPTIAGAQAANELLNIAKIRASFVLTEHNGIIYVSARSIDEINVQLIMERLGGGGHMNMAGAQLHGVSLGEGRKKMEDTLAQMIKEGEITI